MKKYILFSLIVFLGNTFLFSQEVKQKDSTENVSEETAIVLDSVIELHWEKSFKKALKKSKKEDKPVLVYFTGSDWCGPCIVLDRKLFHTQKFKSFADDHLILYKVDVTRNIDLVDAKTRKENNKIRRKYRQKKFPTIIMVNYKGKVLGIKKGMYLTEYYFPFFQSIVAKF